MTARLSILERRAVDEPLRELPERRRAPEGAIVIQFGEHKLRQLRLVDRAAYFSECGRYRYWLGRRWDFVSRPRIAVFMLANPSVAGVERDDMTVKKCTGFAKRWGCTGIEVVNQNAFVSTDPDGLRAVFDPTGPDNNTFVMAAIRGQTTNRSHRGPDVAYVVPAWGDSEFNRYPTPQHFAYIAGEVRRGTEVVTLGVTRNGTPRHPSRLGYDTARVGWAEALAELERAKAGRA